MAEPQWGSMTEDLAISLSVDSPVFKPGETIQLYITLKNFGTTPSTIVLWSPWVQFPLSVRNEEGKEVPENPYAQEMREMAYQVRRAIHQLMPGEKVTETLDLDKAYDLQTPGLYTVTAKHPTFKKGMLDQFTEVPSNELAIRIAV